MTKQQRIMKQNRIGELLNSLDDYVKYPVLYAIIDELRMLLDEVKEKRKRVS